MYRKVPEDWHFRALEPPRKVTSMSSSHSCGFATPQRAFALMRGIEESPPTNAPLVRRLGLLQATALNMSNMIGVGPFITIPGLMAAMGGPQAILGWVVALVIALADGLIWSELGAAMPGSGGSYVYLREAFGRAGLGRFMSFLFIWQFLLSGPLEIASGYIGFAQYLQFLWRSMTPVQSHVVMAA